MHTQVCILILTLPLSVMLPGSPWKGSNAIHALPALPGMVKHWVIGDVVINQAMVPEG